MTQSFGLPAPVAAPWATNWLNYPVQFFLMAKDGSGPAGTITVTDGQWWRIIFVSAVFEVTNADFTRTVTLSFAATLPGSELIIGSPGVLTASQSGTFVFGPNLSAIAYGNGTSDSNGISPLPDLIWPPQTLIQVGVNDDRPGDSMIGLPTIAVEIFTENPEGELIPGPEPIASPIIV